MKWRFLIMTLVGLSVLAGCSSIQVMPLTETYIFPDFAFSIDYPKGWMADTDTGQPVTWIIEKEEDFKLRMVEDRKTDGIVIVFDHRTLDWLRVMLGLPEDPSINDLFQLNIDEVTHMVNPTIEEVTLFGVDALRSEFYGENESWGITYAGFIDDEAFLLSVIAPSEEVLEKFKPTLEAMLDSIQPVE